MIKIRNVEGRVVSIGKNLRCIVDRSRRVEPNRIDVFVDRQRGTGQLGVTWADDSFCITDFASDKVLLNHVQNCRWKRGARVIVHNRGEA
jgi:hypothetical protein